MGYEISQHFLVRSIYPVEVGSPLGVMYQPRGVANQFNIYILLTVRTRESKISEQVGDDHSLAVRYEGLHDVGRKIDLICVIGDHVSVLPA